MSGRSDWIRSIACLPSPTAMTRTSSSANVSSITRWIVTLSSASSSLCGMGTHVFGDECDDRLHRGTRQEDAGDTHLSQAGDVHVGNDAADHDQDVGQSALLQQLH